MPEQKQLDHQDFWDRMKKAAEQVDRWPDWEKGSPTNQRGSTQATKTQQAKSREGERSG